MIPLISQWVVRSEPNLHQQQVENYLVDRAGSHSHDGGLQHFALRLLRQHDAPLRYRLCGEALHQHPVKEGEEFSEGLNKRKEKTPRLWGGNNISHEEQIYCNTMMGPLGGSLQLETGSALHKPQTVDLWPFDFKLGFATIVSTHRYN